MKESKTLHYILGVSLMMIAVFVVASLVLINSQAGSNTNVTMNVNNVNPVVTTVHLSSSAGYTGADSWAGAINNITPGAGLHVYVNGQITDGNGWGDINNVWVSVHLSGATEGTTDLSWNSGTHNPNQCGTNTYNCYNMTNTGGGTTCTLVQDGSDGAGLTKKYECDFNLASFVRASAGGPNASVNTDDIWKFQVMAIDQQPDATSSVVTVSKEINAFLGIAIPTNVDFGTLSLGGSTGADSASGPRHLDIMNIANDTQDLNVSATNMTCAIGSIPVANIQYGVGEIGTANSPGYGGGGMAAYSTTPTLLEVNMPEQTTGSQQHKRIFNEITVPAAGIKGPCSGIATYTATASR